MSDLLTHRFIPVVRHGLAAQIKSKAAALRCELTVSLTAVAYTVEGGLAEEMTIGPGASAANQVGTIQLYGPGDQMGFDPRIVVRTDPKADIGDFEANYFPSVEFADVDFPWRYSAEPPEPQEDAHPEQNVGKLRPWIVLVVLVTEDRDDIKAEFEEIEAKDRDPSRLRMVRVLNVSSLPDLDSSWRWAHVRITGGANAVTMWSGSTPAELSGEQTISAVSVLQCARRLAPGVRYSAFVVPARALGRLAALGTPFDQTMTALSPAWPMYPAGELFDLTSSFDLPYYYRWDFCTSKLGDFENLVRLLEPRELPSDLGLRKIDCSKPGFGLPPVEPMEQGLPESERSVLEMEGALRALSTKFTPWGKDDTTSQDGAPIFQSELAALLNEPNTEDLADGGGRTADAAADRTLEFSAESDDRQAEMGFSSIEGSYDLLKHQLTITWKTRRPNAVTLEYRDESSDAKSNRMIVHSDAATQHVTLERLVPERAYTFTIRPVGGDERFETTGAFRIRLPRVVPPAYGRWHHGKLKPDGRIVQAQPQGTWLDMLNLDPRHRAAAGLGAEVVRRNQEPLMASAWEQLGAMRRANEILRKAQLGRDASVRLHQRIAGQSTSEDSFFAMTAAMARMVTLPNVPVASAPGTPTANNSVAEILRTQTMLPLAALDPALRHMKSAGRALSKRQRRVPRQNPLAAVTDGAGAFRRLACGLTAAAGPGHAPIGLARLGEASEALRSSTWPSGPPAPVQSFDESVVTHAALAKALERQPFKNLKDLPDAGPTGVAVMRALDTWLKPRKSGGKDGALTPESAKSVVVALRKQLPKRIDPNSTVVARVHRRFQLDGQQQWTPPSNPRDQLDQIQWAPEFEIPLYELLFELGQDSFLPGIEKIRQNTVACLAVNRRFLESFLCGANHEFAGELLWRGFPTDQRGTCFKKFWDRSESNDPDADDIKAIDEWSALLQENAPDTEMASDGLILVIRGDLLNRYPDTLIYAIDADVIAVPPDGTVNWDDAQRIEPLFFAKLPPDMTFFGFPFNARAARGDDGGFGNYFVIEQAPGAIRHGLDDNPGASTGSDPSWVAFGMQSSFGAYLDSTISNQAPDSHTGVTEESSAAAIASATLQRPVRVVIHGKQLIPKTT
jgi:hypothetical protein